MKINFLIHIPIDLDAEALKREEEAIKLDGLSVAQMKEVREKVCMYAQEALTSVVRPFKYLALSPIQYELLISEIYKRNGNKRINCL